MVVPSISSLRENLKVPEWSRATTHMPIWFSALKTAASTFTQTRPAGGALSHGIYLNLAIPTLNSI
jgi:hypothetical protein